MRVCILFVLRRLFVQFLFRFCFKLASILLHSIRLPFLFHQFRRTHRFGNCHDLLTANSVALHLIFFRFIFACRRNSNEKMERIVNAFIVTHSLFVFGRYHSWCLKLAAGKQTVRIIYLKNVFICNRLRTILSSTFCALCLIHFTYSVFLVAPHARRLPSEYVPTKA